MSLAALLAGLAGVCAVPAAWHALGAADEAQLAVMGRRWLAPALAAARGGRDPTSPERRRLALLGAACLLGAGWLLAGPGAGLVLAAAGPWAARAVVRSRHRRWRARLAADAPVLARALADALSGGHSVRGALVQAARTGAVPGPAGDLLRTAALALELGERTDDVLLTLARRAGGGPYDTLATAVLLQRDAGGDLARALRGLAVVLEERDRAVAEARSATAQARFTAWLVAALPVGGAVLAEVAEPGTVTGLATSPLPALLAGTALVLELLALVVIRRIARVGDVP